MPPYGQAAPLIAAGLPSVKDFVACGKARRDSSRLRHCSEHHVHLRPAKFSPRNAAIPSPPRCALHRSTRRAAPKSFNPPRHSVAAMPRTCSLADTVAAFRSNVPPHGISAFCNWNRPAGEPSSYTAGRNILHCARTQPSSTPISRETPRSSPIRHMQLRAAQHTSLLRVLPAITAAPQASESRLFSGDSPQRCLEVFMIEIDACVRKPPASHMSRPAATQPTHTQNPPPPAKKSRSSAVTLRNMSDALATFPLQQSLVTA